MTQHRMFEFELTFTLPKNEQHDMAAIVDKICGSVPEDDPVIGLGKKGQIGVMLELDGENPIHIMLSAAKRILAILPKGAEVHEFHPDLVSLQQVASQLKTTRQNFRLNDLPNPISGGLYRLSEVSKVLISAYSTDNADIRSVCGEGPERARIDRC